MLLDHDTHARFSGEEAEALFREARRRTRRRRLRRGFALAIVLAGAVLGHLASEGGGGGVVAESASRPFVNVKAFGDEGELAFISRGSLWVLDGAGGSLRRLPVPRGFRPASPTLSRDGRWLAYLVSRESNEGAVSSQLWIAHANGRGAHAVGGLVVPGLVGWSPSADLLAITTDTEKPIVYSDGTSGTFQQTTGLELVTPNGAVRRLLALPPLARAARRIEDAVWSPNGTAIAVSTLDGLPSGRTTVRAYPIAGGPPTTWLSIGTRRSLAGPACGTRGACNQGIADLAGWWPGWGIGFWVYADGMTRNSDGTPLDLLTAPRATPHVVAQTLSDGTTDALAAGAGGALAVVASTPDSGRVYTQGKTVENCTAGTLSCTALPDASAWPGRSAPRPAGAGGSGVSLDPTWSPDGRLLAYVKAPATLTGANPSLEWFGAHELLVWNRKTNATRKLAGVAGVSLPTWSGTGRQLLYVSEDGLWIAPLNAKPTEIEYPLFAPSQWRTVATTGTISFYGQIHWAGQFSWWSP